MPDNNTSPILPHFDVPRVMTPPPPAYFASRTDEDHELMRQRSYSSMSFHVPRRHVFDGSPSTTQDEAPPRIPPKSKNRMRAYTSTDVDAIKERVASAMIEVERLQKQIDEVIERQSLYANSRPSTPHSIARTMPELEPMPSIPALPPAAPSFAERLNSELERPHTAPIKAAPSSTITSVPGIGARGPASPRRDDRPPPPPLPLVLRPPLRKKKSFSRVSSWLFPGSETGPGAGHASVTNIPMPIKGHEGFYQCIRAASLPGRRSYDSLDSWSTWDSAEEQQTAPTTYSPGSTPVAKQDLVSPPPPPPPPAMERTATFGKKDERQVRTGVGVAIGNGPASVHVSQRPPLDTPPGARDPSWTLDRAFGDLLGPAMGMANIFTSLLGGLLPHGRAGYKYSAVPVPVAEDDEESTPHEPDDNYRTRHQKQQRLLKVTAGAMILFAVLALAALYGRAHPDQCGCEETGSCTGTSPHTWGQYSPFFSSPSTIDPVVPKGCELTFAAVLSRHGSRYPTAAKAASYAALVDRIHASVGEYPKGFEFLHGYAFPHRFDDLTLYGQKELARSGATFFQRYKKLASDSEPFIRAAGSPRVIMSAQNFTHAYYQAQGKDSDGPVTKILVLPETKGFNNSLNHGTCAAFETGPWSNLGREKEDTWRAIWAAPIMERLNHKLPGVNFTLQDTVYMMDLCPYGTVNTPDATKSDFCRLFTQEEWRGYDYYGSLEKWYSYGKGNPLGPTQGVGYVNELIARLTGNALVDNTSTNSTLGASPKTFPLDRKLYADFSHDNAMTAIFAALGLYNRTENLPDTSKLSPRQTHGYSTSCTVRDHNTTYPPKTHLIDQSSRRALINVNIEPPRALNNMSETVVDSEKAGAAASAVDDAQARAAAEKKLLRRLDVRIIPPLFALSFLSFLDRANIGNVKIQGIERSLHMQGQDFSVALFVFFVTYIVCEVPSNLILIRLAPSTWMSILMTCWGQGLVPNFGGLVGLRLVLGVFEAGLFPGAIYLMSTYYARYELQWRFSMTSQSTVLAGAFGGLLAFALAKMDGIRGYEGWRWIFIIEGVITVAVGVAIKFWLVNWPDQAAFLSAEDKALLDRKLAEDAGGGAARMDRLDKAACWRIVKDWKIYVGIFMHLTVVISTYSVSFFLPTDMGYSSAEAQLRTVPVYLVAVVFSLTSAWLTDRYRCRYMVIMASLLPGIAGLGVMLAGSRVSTGGRYASCFLAAITAFTTLPTVLAWVNYQQNGRYKRAIASAMIQSGGNFGGIIGSNIWLGREAPAYRTGVSVTLACLVLCGIGSTGYYLGLRAENRRRDRGERDYRLTEEASEVDNLGDDHPSWRFTF
ncbi:histidine acid phosphatase [Purpureocillium lavendulum]|uniref:3-phytase n=1 Tax=Purpureocillium lavendulum TaxID=1247861 RepID=A0AB34FXY0_9HYPO|nr:histidine acid phosphatase [Purpureocillium lavendulum]